MVNLLKSIPSGCLENLRMDPQVILIGIVAFVVSAVLIYLISAFGFKEKSYEEAIAEQKKRLEAEQDKVRKEKKAEKEKKKGKKSKDKPKEKNLQQVNDPEHERKMVNLEIEPEIIEPQLSSDQESKPKSKAKANKSPKPILLNKDEKSKVAPQMQETIHFKAVPKDEVELLHEHGKERKTSLSKPKKEEKVKIETKEAKKAQPVVENMVIVQTQKLQAAAPTPERKAKKALGEFKLSEFYLTSLSSSYHQFLCPTYDSRGALCFLVCASVRPSG